MIFSHCSNPLKVFKLVMFFRVQSVEVLVRATQLFGNETILGTWQVPQNVPVPPPANMTAAQSCAMTLRCLLPVLPNDYPQTDIIT